MRWVWLDGAFRTEQKALLPATDPAFLHGRGLFETLRAYDGIPFRLEDHLRRMRRSARRLRIPFPGVPDLGPVVRELCRRNGTPDAAVRITLSALGHLLVQARPRRRLPDAWYARGARLRIAPWRRDPRAPLSGHKTLNYLENILAHEEALRRGCADTLLVDPRGRILEGCATNLFLVFGGRVVTPPLAQNILPGITRQVVMELVPVRERPVLLTELRKAGEVFLTNSLIEILPVGRPGPTTRRIAEAYRRAVAEEIRRRREGS